MMNAGLNQNQMAVLMPWLNPLIDVIAEKITDKVLTAIKPREPRYYSRAETAQFLHITLPTLARLTKEGLITAKKAGGRVLYEAEAIDEAVKENRVFKYKHAK